jgi:hypothetical protein
MSVRSVQPREVAPTRPRRPDRLTIDATVWIDYIEPAEPRHLLALELFALAERGEVELWAAPQGYRLDRMRAGSAEQLQEAFRRGQVRQALQVARVSEVTFLGQDLIVGHYVKGFAEACDLIAKEWPKAPGPADRFHVETHMVERQDVFITDDKRLLTMCRRLNRDHGFSIVAMGLNDYLERRRRRAGS